MSTGYEALRSGAALLDLSGRGLIVARGRDRARLLHNLTSNDVKKLQPGQGCYAFLLSPQGRIQADLNLFCYEDRFLLDTEPELRAKVMAHIRKYIIADQVELADASGEMAALGLEGPGAAAVLSSLNAPVPGDAYAHTAWEGGTIAAATVTGQPGFRIFVPLAAREDTMRRLEAAGAKPANAGEARIVRMENGRPRYGEDFGENTLPQETLQMHAVSFTKGCYLGQEIVERIRARGHVNRQLARLEVDAAEPAAAGTKLTAGGAEAGEITSAAYSARAGKVVALAYLRVQHAAAGTELDVAGATARVM